jgi:hypothetical protein
LLIGPFDITTPPLVGNLTRPAFSLVAMSAFWVEAGSLDPEMS